MVERFFYFLVVESLSVDYSLESFAFSLLALE
jgi:hypothetical protein